MITLFAGSFNHSISFSKCHSRNNTSLLITQIYSPFANSTPLFRAFVTPTFASNLKYLILSDRRRFTTSAVLSVEASSIINSSLSMSLQTYCMLRIHCAVNALWLKTGTTIESFFFFSIMIVFGAEIKTKQYCFPTNYPWFVNVLYHVFE